MTLLLATYWADIAVRWSVVVLGLATVAVVLWHIQRHRRRTIAVCMTLIATGITAKYAFSRSPILFPGAILYLFADAYVLWAIYHTDKDHHE